MQLLTRGALVSLLVLLALSSSGCLWMGWPRTWHGHGWGWHIGMGFGGLMLLFWVALIGGLFLLARAPQHGPPAAPPTSALDIARTRYAKGEITRDEYEQMRRDLGA